MERKGIDKETENSINNKRETAEKGEGNNF
jgi:hypothetical protein